MEGLKGGRRSIDGAVVDDEEKEEDGKDWLLSCPL